MVDDDEIAKAGKRVRVGDLPIMDRDDGGPFPAAISMPFL